MTCPPDTGLGYRHQLLLLCREQKFARTACRTTIGLRDKLMDGVAGGGVAQLLTRRSDAPVLIAA